MTSKFFPMVFMFALSLSTGLGISVSVDAKQKTSGDAEFLDQFSEHHKDAIKMSELAKAKASSLQIRKIAEENSAKQKQEVEQMVSWRKRHYSSVPKSDSSMPKMDMSELNAKSGKDFDLAFIDMMMKPHDEGIAMAKKATDKLFQPQIKDFVETAIHDQDRDRQRLSLLKVEESRSSTGGTTESN